MSRRILIDDDAAQYANLEERLKRLESSFARPEKIALPFAAGWADYNTSAFEPASYTRIGRLVVLQGLVTKTSGLPAANDIIATLPVGFRPIGGTILFSTMASGAAARVDVQINGNVVWVSGTVAEVDWTTLAGIAFVID